MCAEELKEIKDLRLRRGNRYESFIAKLNHVADLVKIYKNNSAKSIISDIINNISNLTIRETININDTAIYSKYLNVSIEKQKDFIENTIEKIRTAKEILLEDDLREEKEQLNNTYIKDNIEYITEGSRIKYYDSVKYLMHLSKVKKIQDMEKDLFEMQKDLKSCIDYNFKINKELQNLK